MAPVPGFARLWPAAIAHLTVELNRFAVEVRTGALVLDRACGKRDDFGVSGSGFGPALAILAVANEYTTRV